MVCGGRLDVDVRVALVKMRADVAAHHRPRVAVIGGSLGGLTAALVLRDAGCDVTVYERSQMELAGLGAGIVVQEATVRYLTDRLGMTLEDISVGARVLQYLGATGR